jgi:hypothetical protein
VTDHGTESEWVLAFVLPDLVLRDEVESDADREFAPNPLTLGSEHVAIVRRGDPRVESIVARVPAAAVLLSGFHDSYGRPVRPSVLICRRDFPDHVRGRTEPIVAFRNMVAMSCVLLARAVAAGGGTTMAPVWTDVFDLHPTTITIHGGMYTDSPAMKDIRAPTDAFYGAQSPFITSDGRHLHVDSVLYRAFGDQWHRRYVDLVDDQRSRALVRSLEVAYRAASLGRVSLASIHDVGMQISLWVSAIEVLAWQEGGRVDLQAVVDLLARYAWPGKFLADSRYTISFRKTKIAANAVQKGYELLYQARNDFLHGEPVDQHTLRPPTAPSAQLTVLAAIVYRAALAAYMRLKAPDWNDPQAVARAMADHNTDSTYSHALATQFGAGVSNLSDYLRPPE